MASMSNKYPAQKREKNYLHKIGCHWLTSELLTLYYNGVDVYSKRHDGDVSIAFRDWWALVCSLNPTFWIHEFYDYTQNLYDIITTWPDDDATFRRWTNILERYIKKETEPKKRASFLNSLLQY